MPQGIIGKGDVRNMLSEIQTLVDPGVGRRLMDKTHRRYESGRVGYTPLMIRRPFTYLVAVLCTALIAAGCAKNDQSTSSASVSHGAEVFAANCVACHGAAGVGGAGPSLRGESQRKNLEAIVAWIKQPVPPMPKLYPVPLSEHDVEEVAAYVQSL